ncbi:MAG: hypothetical protein IT462_10310, partial [Planctomycetes bacterium]|nr:hypothetical protein [Planctomycetota bacterium]
MALRAMLVLFLLTLCGALHAQTAGNYTYGEGPNTPPAGTKIRQSRNPNPMLQLEVKRDGGDTDTLKDMKVWATSGSYNMIPRSDIPRMQLWLDENGDGNVNAGEQELRQADLDRYETDWLILFTNVNLPITSAGVMLIVTVDVTAEAAQTNYLGLQMYDGEDADYGIWDMTFAAGSTTTVIGEYPDAGYLEGPLASVGPNYSQLSVAAGEQVPAANCYPGSLSHPVLQFRIIEDDSAGPPTVTRVTLRRGSSTVAPADITAIRLYRENLVNGYADGGDAMLAVGTSVGYFDYQFDISVAVDGTANLLAVVDVAPGAVIGRKFQMYVASYDIVHNAPYMNYGWITEEAQTIITPTANNLAMIDQPLDAIAGGRLNTPSGIRVEARNGLAIDTTFNGNIVAEVASGPADFTSSSQVLVKASAGVAMFYTLAFAKPGAYTIRFVSPPLTPSAVSNTFNITHGPAYRLTITAQPSDGVVGAPLPPPPVVEARDFYDNLVVDFGGQITAGLVSSPSGATVQNNQVFAVNGVATFTNLLFNKAGSGYSLLFAASGVASTNASEFFSMAVGAPSQLVVTVQPGNILGGGTIVPQPRVQVRDAGGNAVTGYVGDVTATIAVNPGGATLSGTITAPVTAAMALFSSLSMDHAGVGYVLQFSIAEGATCLSAAFDVSVGPPLKLGIVSQPTDTTGGMPFAPVVVVEVQDAGGNVIVADDSSDIT